MNRDLHTQPPALPPLRDSSGYQAAGTNGHGGEHKLAGTAKRRRANRTRTAVDGTRVIKLRAVGTAGGLVVDTGAWKIGHGKLLVSGENAMDAIAQLDEAIEKIDKVASELQVLVPR